MIELYTDRLRLRSLQQSDWENFLALHLDPEVNRYVRQPEGQDVIERKFVQRCEPWFYSSGDWLTLVIEESESGKFVGLSGFHCVSLEYQQAEVGYLLTGRAQGQGYGTESLRAVIDWACLSFAVHKFIAHCARDNTASARLLEKCGFRLEGILRHNLKIADDWVDDCAYGLLAQDRQA